VGKKQKGGRNMTERRTKVQFYLDPPIKRMIHRIAINWDCTLASVAEEAMTVWTKDLRRSELAELKADKDREKREQLQRELAEVEALLSNVRKGRKEKINKRKVSE
jgi:hypothetical protein